MQRLLGSGAGLQKVACRQAQEAVSSNCSRLLSCRASGPGPSSTRMFQGDCAAGRNPKQTRKLPCHVRANLARVG